MWCSGFGERELKFGGRIRGLFAFGGAEFCMGGVGRSGRDDHFPPLRSFGLGTFRCFGRESVRPGWCLDSGWGGVRGAD